MAVAFFLLGEKGLAVLNGLSADHLPAVKQVLIGRDRNVQNDFSKEIKIVCEERNISSSFENASSFDGAEILVAIGWRWIINKTGGQQLIIVHDSLLPKYRGFNPLVSALINGDTEVGATALWGGSEYDTGDIIDQQSVHLSYPLKINAAIGLMANCYQRLAISIMNKIINNIPITAYRQDEAKATYSLWRDKEDYFINWNEAASKIKRMVDAIGFPYAGSKFVWEENEYTLLEATAMDDLLIENRCPGKLIFKSGGQPVIVCGTGLLRLDEVVDSNSSPVSFSGKFRIRLK